jgi:hypothetical protein
MKDAGSGRAKGRIEGQSGLQKTNGEGNRNGVFHRRSSWVLASVCDRLN